MTTHSEQPIDVRQLQETVQANCHISDARFASDYTLCVYLLKMREFFRWENGLDYGASLSGESVGNWLTEREQLWESLENAAFSPLAIDGTAYQPFDSAGINKALNPHGLIYSGGYGTKSKPVFFLAELERTIEHKGYHVYVAGRELARDLTAPPAMSLDRRIYIRRESLRRMLWEKLEEWRWNKPDNAMGRAIRFYNFDDDLSGSLDTMTNNEVEALVLHEIGEIRAGEHLGEDWHQMLQSFPRSRLELMARAVRDHLADALSTLPTLLERMDPPSLHFYFANLGGMRKMIYPTLMDAYNQWTESGRTDRLRKQIDIGKRHWLHLARQMLDLHQKDKNSAGTGIETLIEQSYL